MSTAKIVRLMASASSWANLSFEVGGIVKDSNITLGQTVTAFDFDTLYAELGVATEKATPAIPTQKLLPKPPPEITPYLLNSSDLSSAILKSELMTLRSEGIQAALDKACALRANAYYAKYANQAAIIARARANYSPTSANSKPDYLSTLSTIASDQESALIYAYTADNRAGVVKSTSSTLQASGTETNSSNKVTGKTSDSQEMIYTNYGYRIPALEATAGNSRAQISLIDEQFTQFMAGQSLPYLESVFANELRSVDMDVKRLQVGFLNTILLSPISGLITGIYKQPGDAVLAGETVMRVENNATVFLIGVLIYPGMISLGANVTVETNLFGVPPGTNITGTIVAARGDQGGDDRWAVVISCPNTNAGGATILPLNYSFDFDDTSVTIN
jgi:hypothetical protein